MNIKKMGTEINHWIPRVFSVALFVKNLRKVIPGGSQLSSIFSLFLCFSALRLPRVPQAPFRRLQAWFGLPKRCLRHVVFMCFGLSGLISRPVCSIRAAGCRRRRRRSGRALLGQSPRSRPPMCIGRERAREDNTRNTSIGGARLGRRPLVWGSPGEPRIHQKSMKKCPCFRGRFF